MTLEEMMAQRDPLAPRYNPQMPGNAPPPSIEELFRQGNVQVTPGAGGPRTTGNVPPSPMAAGFGGLADLYKMGAEAPEGTTSPQLDELMALAEPHRQELEQQEAKRLQMEHEAGEPARKAAAAVAQAKAEQPFKLEQIRETGEVQKGVDVARILAEQKSRQEIALDTPFANPLFLGKTPRQIAAMSPEQWQAYAGTIVGSTKIKDLGQFIQALMTAAATKPGLFTDSQIKLLIGKQMAVQANEPINNFVSQSLDSKGNVIYDLKIDFGLTPTAAGPRVTPSGGMIGNAIRALGGLVTPAAPQGPGGPPMAAESQFGLNDFLTRPPMRPMTPPARR